MRTVAIRTRAALALAALVAIGPGTARAQSPTAATTNAPSDDDLVAAGVALRKQGRDVDALAAFERAYALHPSSRAIAQIALAHQALGHWREAEQGLKDALADSSDAWIARNRPYLEESLGGVQARLGWLEVESNIDGAEAWSGGQLLGRLPLAGPVRVPAGDVAVEVRASGYAPLERTFHVVGNTTVHAAFMFVVKHAPPPPAPEPIEAPSASPRVEPPRVEPRGTAGGSAGWALLGSGGGLVLAGIAGLVTREWEAQIYDDNRRCGPLDGQTRYQRCGTNRDIGSAAQTVAIVSFSGAAVAGLTSAALLWWIAPRATATKQLGCAAAGLGIACGGIF